ncbi:nucleoside triphosphate pyrophosphohydrolase [Synechococcales cyanobacterium C]|uniref:Nucleoside triphosphate pyrophosphohydrolase n=2 Tax=Petrachloros TaxID=2918834 RepID=A0A8K1ZW57_9CYAN|nr:nucleoside triphosphate pyrophosphohydrolase [Petrachloros mirabilis ULC683]
METMANSSVDAKLQVMPVSDLLSQPLSVQAPALITQIGSEATLHTLKAALQAQLSLQQSVTLLDDLNTPSPQVYHSTLEQVTQHQGLAFPVSLYISAQVSASAIAVQQLANVVSHLREPDGGCPWDLAQTPQSLTPYILEEAYETVDAIEQGDTDHIADELGDLLLQIVLQAQIASEQQNFTLQTIAEAITAKLIRRHPHVFGDLKVDSIDQVHANWEQIKADEEQSHPDQPTYLSHKLQRYARSLPPLMAGLKLSEKTAASGLEWETIDGVWAKFYEELAEFQEALLQDDIAHQQDELGDLIFTLVNIARWCQLDPSKALRSTNTKLIERVSHIEANTSKPLTEHTLQELDALWQQAKRQSAPAITPATPADPSPGLDANHTNDKGAP